MFGKELLNEGSLVWTIAFGVWAFFYWFYCWGAGGKTPGAALLGIRVVRRDGGHLGFRRAFVRTVVFPFSFLFFGLGLIGVVIGREHRALHDVAAGQHGRLRLGRARRVPPLPRQAHGLSSGVRTRSGSRGCRWCCRDRWRSARRRGTDGSRTRDTGRSRRA